MTRSFISDLFNVLDATDFSITSYPRLNSPMKLEDDIIEFELPGVDKSKVTINVEGDTITVVGEDRHKRKFERSRIYSKEYNLENVEANMKDGLLTIKIPVKKDTKKVLEKKVIQIKEGG